ncbi:hypothetical protein AB0N61_10310 [Microbacterium sp. NPDC089320]|uniref:hypothetical protein n=1 Tax=Microbacterium sp. NPDC089320 TaxID=3155182 RepID=UPI00342398B7
MPETVIVALVTGGLVFLSGASATLGQILAPAWHEKRRRAVEERDAAKEAEAETQRLAAELLETVASIRSVGNVAARHARIRFLGSLSTARVTPEILSFTANLIDPGHREVNAEYVDFATNDLFAWLAGDKPSSELQVRYN